VARSFEEWASKPEVKEAWEKIQGEEGLRAELNPWKSTAKVTEIFATLDAAMLGGWSGIQTMDKAKKLGWRGHVQTDESFRDTIERMVEMKMVPKLSI